MTTNTDNKSIPGSSITADQIAAWKKAHGKIFSYSADDKIAYLKAVDRDVYSLATAKMGNVPALFNKTVIDGIWLGGDEVIRTDDRYYFGLIDFVEELMAKKKGTLLEL